MSPSQIGGQLATSDFLHDLTVQTFTLFVSFLGGDFLKLTQGLDAGGEWWSAA